MTYLSRSHKEVGWGSTRFLTSLTEPWPYFFHRARIDLLSVGEQHNVALFLGHEKGYRPRPRGLFVLSPPGDSGSETLPEVVSPGARVYHYTFSGQPASTHPPWFPVQLLSIVPLQDYQVPFAICTTLCCYVLESTGFNAVLLPHGKHRTGL